MIEFLACQPPSPVKRSKFSLMEAVDDEVSLNEYSSIFDEQPESVVPKSQL